VKGDASALDRFVRIFALRSHGQFAARFQAQQGANKR